MCAEALGVPTGYAPESVHGRAGRMMNSLCAHGSFAKRRISESEDHAVSDKIPPNVATQLPAHRRLAGALRGNCVTLPKTFGTHDACLDGIGRVFFGTDDTSFV